MGELEDVCIVLVIIRPWGEETLCPDKTGERRKEGRKRTLCIIRRMAVLASR